MILTPKGFFLKKVAQDFLILMTWILKVKCMSLLSISLSGLKIIVKIFFKNWVKANKNKKSRLLTSKVFGQAKNLKIKKSKNQSLILRHLLQSSLTSFHSLHFNCHGGIFRVSVVFFSFLRSFSCFCGLFIVFACSHFLVAVVFFSFLQ